jgi:hypothetical protein
VTFGDLFEAQKRWSSYYRFTHVPGDPDTEASLAQLKDTVKQHNKTADENSKLQVKLYGRMGGRGTNPNAYKYYRSNAKMPLTLRSSYQYINKADAAHFDVYVSPRQPPWGKTSG